ncbi:MAG: efflux RND transporter permease subunit [Thermoanaerobaculia bacterium]
MPFRPLRALLIVLGLSLVALPWTLRLRLDPDLLSLLPVDTPAAEEFRRVEELFGGLERVFVVIRPERGDEPSSPAQLAEAAGVLATELETLPGVAWTRAGVRPEEEAYWLQAVVARAPLLLPGDWEAEVRRRLETPVIERRVREMRRTLVSPVGTAAAELLVHDPLGFSDAAGLLQRTASGLPLDPLTGTFLAADGSAALVVVEPAEQELHATAGWELERGIAASCRHAEERVGAGLRCDAVGGPLYATHDARLLKQDMVRTVWSSAGLCLLVLVLALDGVLLPLLALAALLPALVWTGAAAHALLGPLAAVSAGFAAVLVGLGVDYGIHAVVRFRESRLGGATPAAAWRATLREAGPGVVSSALTTTAGFGVLMFAHLPPLRDLGAVLALGMLCTLVATALTAGGLLVSCGERRPFCRVPGRGWTALGRLVDGVSRFAESRRRLVLTAAVLSVPLALIGACQLHVSSDLRALRPEDHPLRRTETLLAERFGLGLDTATIAVPGGSEAEALERASRLAIGLRRALGPELTLTTPSDLIVADAVAARRLARLRDLPLEPALDTLRRELRAAGLDPDAFRPGLEALAALAAGRDPAAGRALPEGLGSTLLRRGEGRTWAAVHLRLPLERWPEGPPPELLATIRELAPGAVVASAPRLGAALRRVASADLKWLSLLAAGLVGGVAVASFRGRVRDALLALVPVCLGILWTCGLLGALGFRLDLISLALVPILFGIGIDDGLHAVHGARLHPAAGLPGAVRAAGRAMTLTSLTTAAAFGSLLLSRLPGLRGGGLAVALGVLASLAATLLVLPALRPAPGRSRHSGGAGGPRPDHGTHHDL